MSRERPGSPARRVSDAVLRVGLTGGIAAGKSVAARRLAELGAAVVDHDVLAREVVGAGTPGLAAVVQAFGPTVLDAAGGLDRARLGSIVFQDARARERLEAIVHPLIRAAARDAEQRAIAEGHGVVVHDIPLLVETADPRGFDLVAVVEAPTRVRLRRLVEGRGLSDEQARRRLAAQADDEARRAVADVVWDGSGSPHGLVTQVDRWWERLRAS